MNINWVIYWTHEAEKYFNKYPNKARLKKIIHILKENPYQGANIKKLTGELTGLHRYRFSNLRLIYQINEADHSITLIYFGTRGDIY